MITDINSEDRLVQKTFADHMHDHLGWENVYAYNAETFGPAGTLGRKSEREAVLVRERLKEASKALLASLGDLLRPMPGWTQNTNTQAEVKVFILDSLWRSLPRPLFTDEETESVADRVYDYVWQRSTSGHTFMAA
jgi:hypothetical protein